MKILYKAPGEALRSMVIPNELGVMQQLVDGYIEPITLPDNLVIICNEEGKINEWCDHSYNSRYGTKSIRQSKKMINGKLSKAVIATLPDGTEEEYPSMAEAHRQLGCSQGRISDACLGKIDSYHHGRKWRFKGAAT